MYISFWYPEKKPVVPGLTISKKPIDNRFKSRKPELIKKTDKCKPTNIRTTKTITYSADNDSTSSKTEADQFISNISSKYEREIKNLEIKPVSERVAEIVTNNGKYENAVSIICIIFCILKFNNTIFQPVLVYKI